MQLGRGRKGKPESDAVAANTGKHSVVDEVGVKSVDFLCGHAGELEDQRVDLRLEAGFGSVGFHDVMDIKVRRLLVRALVDGMNPSYQLARFTTCVCRDDCLAVDRRLSTADIQGLPRSTRMNPPLTQGAVTLPNEVRD